MREKKVPNSFLLWGKIDDRQIKTRIMCGIDQCYGKKENKEGIAKGERAA